MSDAVNTFFDCCQRVIAGDEALLAQLRLQGFTCGAGEWLFTLPALHGFLQGELDDGAPSYQVFIQALFASDLNQRLGEQGAEIAIAENHGKVNLSRYCLRHRSS